MPEAASRRDVIDLHTHLLPDVDDGASSLEEALALCRHAAEDGTGVAVVTPHSAGHGLPSGRARPRPEDVETWTAALQAEVDGAGVGLRLVPGMEVYAEPDLLDRPDSLMTLGGSRYLLLELPSQRFPPGTPDLVFRLQLAGYVPIIAHPERNENVAARPELLYGLVSRGCLAQVTAMSLTGGAGRAARAAAELLLRADLVHVIASDAHRLPERPAGLSAAVARAARIVGEARARAMVTSVPQAVLDDRPVTGFSPVRPRRRRRWFGW